MHAWSPEDIARLLGSPWSQAGARALPRAFLPSQISTDTRSLRPGDLFVALGGERFAGEAFVAQAQEAGAAACIVPLGTASEAALCSLQVEAPLRALGTLAHALRLATARPVVGVTGSNGKTTTKELLAAALSARGPVHRTFGNLNNFVGVPKTLFAWPDDAWAAVVEMGMNAPGEIGYLTQMCRPNVGLVTCVAAAHLEGLGSIEGVARAKAELFREMQQDGLAVVNADDAVLMAAAAPHLAGRRVLRFGTAADCDVQLVDTATMRLGGSEAAPRYGQRVALRAEGRVHTAQLPLVGRHNALNAAGALACAVGLGVEAQAALAAMSQVVLPAGRLALSRLAGRQVDVLDDGYNANPGSMRAALRTVQELAEGRRVVAVLGDMLELGADAAALHRTLGTDAGKSGVALVFALGTHAQAVAQAARAAGAQAQAFAEVEPLITALAAALAPHDWLLLKGSRGMRIERVAAGLRALDAPPALGPPPAGNSLP